VHESCYAAEQPEEDLLLAAIETGDRSTILNALTEIGRSWEYDPSSRSIYLACGEVRIARYPVATPVELPLGLQVFPSAEHPPEGHAVERIENHLHGGAN